MTLVNLSPDPGEVGLGNRAYLGESQEDEVTVYEYFQEEAATNRHMAMRAETKRISESFLEDAQKWESRAVKLTVEEGSKLVGEVLLWRIIEAVDGRTL